MKIIYSTITKDNIEVYTNFIKKLRKDMRIVEELNADSYIFAIDERRKKIVSYIGLEKNNMSSEKVNIDNPTIPEYRTEDLSLNMVKLAINHARKLDVNLGMICTQWDEYQKLKELGFEIDEQDYNFVMRRREMYLADLNEANKDLLSNDKNIRKNAKRRIDFIKDNLNRLYCHLELKKENVKNQYQIDRYVESSNLPKEYIFSNKSFKDPYIFKEDDKYLYGELKKTDKEYYDAIFEIAKEITSPNLKENGGTLHGYTGLEFPELLVYLKDKKSNIIVGYVGLTTNYGIGDYILHKLL